MTERDTNLDRRSLDWAVEIIGMCEPIRCVQGGMWFGRNNNFADATFVDYGAADAFAVAAKALPDLVKALQDLLFWNEGILAGRGNHHPQDHINKIKGALAAVSPPSGSGK